MISEHTKNTAVIVLIVAALVVGDRLVSPKGFDSLRAELSSATNRIAQLERVLGSMTPRSPGITLANEMWRSLPGWSVSTTDNKRFEFLLGFRPNGTVNWTSGAEIPDFIPPATPTNPPVLPSSPPATPTNPPVLPSSPPASSVQP